MLIKTGTKKFYQYQAISGKAAAAGGATTTFDPANTSANCSLDATKLIVTQNIAGGYNATKTLASYSSGKKFCKFTINVFNGSNSLIGIGNAAAPLTNFTGASANAIGYAASGAVWLNSGGPVGQPLAFFSTPGDVVLMAVDFGANQIWWKLNAGNWNNVAGGDPTNTSTGHGILLTDPVGPLAAGPYFAMACNNAITAQITADFTTTTGMPAGYTTW